MNHENRKVLHVITGLRTGGAENMLALILENTKENNIQHIVVSIRPDGASIRKRIDRAGVKIHDLGLTGIINIMPALFRLVSLIKSIKPNVVQGWMYHGDLFSTLALLLSKRRNNTKLFWGVRCSDIDLKQYSLQLRVVFFLCRLLSKAPDSIVANSFAGAEYHKRAGYHDNFIVIENGVDVERFKPDIDARQRIRDELGLRKDEIVLVMAARMDPMKNHASFINAFKRLHGISAIIAGEGTENLQKLPNLYLLGIRSDINKIFSASDIVVSSSDFGEGFSNSIVEGMACGLPVVATNVGDSKRLVGEAGFIVPAKNPAELKNRIKSMVNLDVAERKKLGVCARKLIVEKYTIQRTVDKFSRIYSR